MAQLFVSTVEPTRRAAFNPPGTPNAPGQDVKCEHSERPVAKPSCGGKRPTTASGAHDTLSASYQGIGKDHPSLPLLDRAKGVSASRLSRTASALQDQTAIFDRSATLVFRSAASRLEGSRGGPPAAPFECAV